MSILQSVLLVMTILSVLYQAIKVTQIGAMVQRAGSVHLRGSLFAMFLATVAIEAAFVLSMTGVHR